MSQEYLYNIIKALLFNIFVYACIRMFFKSIKCLYLHFHTDGYLYEMLCIAAVKPFIYALCQGHETYMEHP